MSTNQIGFDTDETGLSELRGLRCRPSKEHDCVSVRLQNGPERCQCGWIQCAAGFSAAVYLLRFTLAHY